MNEITEKIQALRTLSEFKAQDLVSSAQVLGERLGGKPKGVDLKTAQIRKFLDAIKKLDSRTTQENFDPEKVILLKVPLAYAAGKQKKVKLLMEVLEPCIDKVNTHSDFKKIVQFIEAIVAYHKYYGGQD